MSSARTRSVDPAKPILEAKDITFAYAGTSTPVLRGVNLSIQAGEFILLAGPSGCGKSTLARCLSGFIPQEFAGDYHGLVRIMGHDTSTRPIHELARTVSLVQQDPDGQIVTLNVSDEVAFGPENFLISSREIARRTTWALTATNAAHLRNRSTLALSGGEKQRIVLAALLAVKAPILLFDEPTARLDPPTARDLVTTLCQLNRGHHVTLVVIEHRLHYFLPFVTRCLLMKEGRLVYDGPASGMERKRIALRRLGVLPAAPKRRAPPLVWSGRNRQPPLLEVEKLTFTYPNDVASSGTTPVLQDVSFTVVPGEIVALMGANGSGKSTLLYHLIGLLRPDEGTVRLAGRSIRNESVSRLARDVGFVFQNPLHQLFERTVWDELLLASRHLGKPSPRVAALRARALSERFELNPYRDRSPFALSFGEQRRLTIASILIHRPPLLLLDEPFIGQDYANVNQLMILIGRAAEKGATIILATHDPALARAYCRRLLFLHQGRLLLDADLPHGFSKLEQLGVTQYTPTPGLSPSARPAGGAS